MDYRLPMEGKAALPSAVGAQRLVHQKFEALGAGARGCEVRMAGVEARERKLLEGPVLLGLSGAGRGNRTLN